MRFVLHPVGLVRPVLPSVYGGGRALERRLCEPLPRDARSALRSGAHAAVVAAAWAKVRLRLRDVVRGAGLVASCAWPRGLGVVVCTALVMRERKITPWSSAPPFSPQLCFALCFHHAYPVRTQFCVLFLPLRALVMRAGPDQLPQQSQDLGARQSIRPAFQHGLGERPRDVDRGGINWVAVCLGGSLPMGSILGAMHICRRRRALVFRFPCSPCFHHALLACLPFAEEPEKCHGLRDSAPTANVWKSRAARVSEVPHGGKKKAKPVNKDCAEATAAHDAPMLS